MRKILLICSISYFPIYSCATCNQQVQEQFNNIVTTKKYDISIVEPIYRKCSQPSIEVIYYIAKAKEFEAQNNISSTLQNYRKALSTIEENSDNLVGFNDITVEINDKIIYYQNEDFISSDALDREGFISTRGDINLGGTRDAQLRHYESLKGIPINFKTNSSKIQKGVNKKQADAIGKILSSKYKNKKIYITGFTDTRGRASHNKTLSKARANSLRRYLVKNYRLIKNKIRIDGFGEKSPICESGHKQKSKRGNEYSCTGRENYYKGRRVTIEIGR